MIRKSRQDALNYQLEKAQLVPISTQQQRTLFTVSSDGNTKRNPMSVHPWTTICGHRKKTNTAVKVVFVRIDAANVSPFCGPRCMVFEFAATLWDTSYSKETVYSSM